MSDIVERLRQPWPPSHSEDPLMTEAADEITRLKAEVERLTETERRKHSANVSLQGQVTNRTDEIARLKAEVKRLTEVANQAEAEAAAEITRLREEVDRMREALTAIEKLALQASISSCTCITKTPDIAFHDLGCRYVLLQYIVAQCEDARSPSHTGED